MAGRSGHHGGRLEPPETTGKHEGALFRARSGLLPIHGCAVGSRHFAPVSGFSDTILPVISACGGAVWLNIALFAVVEASRSPEECAGFAQLRDNGRIPKIGSIVATAKIATGSGRQPVTVSTWDELLGELPNLMGEIDL